MNNEAFSISAIDDGFDNGIAWNIEGHTFNLWGRVPMDELKKVAENTSEN